MGLSKKELVRRSLRDMINNNIDCTIQHDGWPCNTCFHDWAVETAGLNPYLAHVFWGIILVLRGDYTQEEIMNEQVINVLEAATCIKGKKK